MTKSAKPRSARVTSTTGRATRPVWLTPALVVLAGAVTLSGLVWVTLRYGTTPAQTATMQAGRANGPRIAVEKDLFDYGDVHFNTPVETKIRVLNVGDEALALEQEPAVELVEGC